ncbi:M3 family metallopeptidase [Candidatus Peregrinibacteria bacterium]|nr:M3 family metallopeptidase [Candidatus Peregrinibacteria bacterium]
MKNKALLEKITKRLHTKGLIDYHFLSSKEVIKNYEKILEHFLEESKKSFESILQTPKEKQSFESLVEKFLNHDKELSTLFGFFTNYHHTCSSEITRKIIENFQPKIVAWSNFINMNRSFYNMLKNIKVNQKDPQKLRSLALIIESMEHNGVHLEKEKKKSLEKINTQLAALSEKFSLHVIDSKKEFFHHLKSSDPLKEMPKEELLSAEKEAKNRKLKGFVFTLSPPSYMAIMKYCSDSKIRKIFYEKYHSIASSGKYDNRPLVLKMLTLRNEKAKILGYKNYSEYVLTQRMAKDIGEVKKVLDSFVVKSRKKAKKDFEELKKYSNQKNIEAWDMSYFSEKLMKEKFDIDQEMLKQYFPLSSVFEGLFTIVKKLYNITLNEVDLKSYHKDVRCFEVKKEGKLLAYYMLDMYARTEKQPGAWCDCLRSPITKNPSLKQLPIVLNVGNFSKPAKKSDAVLLNHMEVQTLFHEFGHALHVMLSNASYENLNGFHTEWDFVELPSQILENWTWNPEALKLYAHNVKTKEVLPGNLLEKLYESRKFMSGVRMLRQNEFGFLDLILHSSAPPKTVKELDEKCLQIAQKYSLFKKKKNYKMHCSFSHIFAGGYASGYYSYLWAEILEADAFSIFEKEGVLNRSVGKCFEESVLAAGAQKPASELFKDFLGRGAKAEALERKYGL